MNNENKQIPFKTETKMTIGKTTYIVTAHFDNTKEPLKRKINHLLNAEIGSLTTA